METSGTVLTVAYVDKLMNRKFTPDELEAFTKCYQKCLYTTSLCGYRHPDELKSDLDKGLTVYRCDLPLADEHGLPTYCSWRRHIQPTAKQAEKPKKSKASTKNTPKGVPKEQKTSRKTS